MISDRVKKYRILVNGRNFHLLSGDFFGFYTTRYVESEDEIGAVEIALSLIRDELYEYITNKPPDGPMMYVEEIEELEDFPDDVLIPGKGFSFYPGEDDFTVT